jgi:hypothetical protein
LNGIVLGSEDPLGRTLENMLKILSLVGADNKRPFGGMGARSPRLKKDALSGDTPSGKRSIIQLKSCRSADNIQSATPDRSNAVLRTDITGIVDGCPT